MRVRWASSILDRAHYMKVASASPPPASGVPTVLRIAMPGGEPGKSKKSLANSMSVWLVFATLVA
jgi:hypothetical protein